MMRFVLLSMLAVSLPQEKLLLAGSEAHGGSVIACFATSTLKDKVKSVLVNNKKKDRRDDPLEGIDFEHDIKVETLDLYIERRTGLPGQTPVSLMEVDPQQSNSFLDVAHARIEILRGKTEFYDTFASLADQWIQRDKWVKAENGVVVVEDSGNPMNESARCLPLMIALQDHLQIFYDSRLFDLLSLLDRAAIVLHETLWKQAIQQGHSDSRSVQKFVGMMFNKDFESRSGVSINHVLRDQLYLAGNISASEPVEVRGEKISAQIQEGVVGVVRYDSGNVKEATLFGKDPVLIQGIFAKGGSRIVFYESGSLMNITLGRDAIVGGYELAESSLVLFYDNGAISQIFSRKPLRIRDLNCLESNVTYAYGQLALISGSAIDFYESGGLKSCRLRDPAVVQGIPLEAWYIEFYENGSLRFGTLARNSMPVTLKDKYNRPVKLEPGRTFVLDEAGLVTTIDDREVQK